MALGKGRPAIPVDLKNPDIYKNDRILEGQKEYNISATAELKAPKNMSSGAKKEWKRIIGLYRDTGKEILNDLDIQLIASYCIAVDIRNKLYEQWLMDEKILKQQESHNTSVTTNGSGKPIRGQSGTKDKTEVNPILIEIDRYNKSIKMLAEQLMLTPASRAAYAAKKEKQNRNSAEVFMDDE